MPEKDVILTFREDTDMTRERRQLETMAFTLIC
uniref:Uncharacterized protein n=1 Tax=Siphoviridae sp. ctitf6 TaxID=2825627 RepID=A0A8S5P2K5_9CAUD|nr:MAG TPA: hypothetical protein [Siphoviridae sp. ctitf6]